MKQDATTVAEGGSTEYMTASYTIAIAGLRSTSLPNVCMYVCICDLKFMYAHVCMYVCIYKLIYISVHAFMHMYV